MKKAKRSNQGLNAILIKSFNTMINLQISDYLSKLSDSDIDYLSETLSKIVKANPKAKIILMDDSKALIIEKINRIRAYTKVMEQVRSILKY